MRKNCKQIALNTLHISQIMNVLIVAERFWPEVGAAPSRLLNMAEGLKEQGCDVDVVTSLPNYPKGEIFEGYKRCISKYESHRGINIFRYWVYATVSHNPIARAVNMFSFAIMIWLFAFKFKRIKQYDYIVIQTPTLVSAVSAMILFKKVFRKKCILNVSDIWPSTAVDMGVMKVGSRSYNFMAWCEKFLYKNCAAVLGQSQEILDHVKKYIPSTPQMLYRNLQSHQTQEPHTSKHKPLRLVFSGMLGVAQDVLSIVKNVPFKDLDVEFHIIGGGKQFEEIKQYVDTTPDCGIHLYGFMPKEKTPSLLREFDASIVPLVTHIQGAFPSKIYDIIPLGLPILFCGKGEPANFITANQLGYTSLPRNYDTLIHNIHEINNLSDVAYQELSKRCIEISNTLLDFNLQMSETVTFIKSI